MIRSNFSFLAEKWPILAELGEMAEKNIYHDPNTTLIKLRLFGETMAKFILAFENLEEPLERQQVDRLNLFRREDILTEELLERFHSIRKLGNKAAHDGYGTTEDAKALLHMTFRLAVWFMQVYGQWDFKEPEYVELQVTTSHTLEQERIERLTASYEQRVSELEQQLEQLRQTQKDQTTDEKNRRHAQAKRRGTGLYLTEAETRLFIDQKLREAGWEADTKNIRFSKGVRPQKGKNLAIAEWPLKHGFADYALFVGLELVGIVEAKRQSKDIQSDIEQAKKYAKQVVRHDNEILCGRWGDYEVPFVFATNGRPYLKQLKHKSGIWFLDTRRPTNHPYPLKAWYSPEGLKEKLHQDEEKAGSFLQEETMDYLNLRDYQQKAIQAVEASLLRNRRHILLAMATGTGKTRTAIGLIYRLIKSKRFKRVLFLVDRNALGQQAEDAFKDSKLENFMSFTDIFELQSLTDKKPNPETKVHIATVQGMLYRIFYREGEEDGSMPTVDQYDCIVVDEAHRGYTLDREMSGLELNFRDHQDYVSKYRQVLDYFDAVKIGLTATPALHGGDFRRTGLHLLLP